MSLRRQLMLVSLLLLSLPWVGCQYLREMEATLRQGQGMAANATAQAIAGALRERADLLYPGAARSPTALAEAQWYLPSAGLPLIADGYEDDWREAAVPEIEGLPEGLSMRAAIAAQRLYLLLRIDDATLQYRRPGSAGDRVVLLCGDQLGATRRYTVDAEGPGALRVRSGPDTDRFADRVRGALRETVSGYTVELQLPLDSRCERLAVDVIDATPTGDLLRFSSRRLHGGALPTLVYRVAALEDWLDAFAAPGRTISVRDNRGWIVAREDALATAPVASDAEVFWLWRVLIRAILRSAPQRTDTGVAPWRSEETSYGDRILLHADADIAAAAGALGTVRVSESTERYLALTDRAATRVFAVSATVLALAFLGLIAFATILSLRVRRLRNAAQEIADERRDLDDFPRSRASDELGDLSRSYAALLDQVAEYNRYLRGLASTLSHELRTPIAVVGSSLDNLARADASDAERETYRQRATEGLARLTRIVAAMSEASRIEASLEGAEFRQLDVGDLLTDLGAAYGDSFPEHGFPVTRDGALGVRGSGELLAQALDKLVDNACSFAPEGAAIGLSAVRRGDTVELAVSNPGPQLPEDLRERLFEPMVSVRESRGADAHLGIGLHVARTIADAHGGRLTAANLRDGSGVVFTLSLPADDGPAATAG